MAEKGLKYYNQLYSEWKSKDPFYASIYETGSASYDKGTTSMPALAYTGNVPKEWIQDPYKYYEDIVAATTLPDAEPGQYDVVAKYGYYPTSRRYGAIKILADLEMTPDYESFYSGRALGEAKRQGQMGTTGKLFRPNTQFAPGYEGRRTKLGEDPFQSGPGKGLNKPSGGNTDGYKDYVDPITGDKYIHKPLPTTKYDGTAPTTALGGQTVQGTQVTGGIYGGPSMPASDKPLAVAAPAKKQTRLGGY